MPRGSRGLRVAAVALLASVVRDGGRGRQHTG